MTTLTHKRFADLEVGDECTAGYTVLRRPEPINTSLTDVVRVLVHHTGPRNPNTTDWLVGARDAEVAVRPITSTVIGLYRASESDGRRVVDPYTLAEMVDAYYEKNSTGGSLHITLDDNNIEGHHVLFCLRWAEHYGDAEGVILAEALLDLDYAERGRLVHGGYRR